MAQAIATVPLEQIAADQELLSYALVGGRAAFNENCAQCHGLGGAGQGFFPTLADDDWLWGGRLEDIEHHDHPRRFATAATRRAIRRCRASAPTRS